LIAQSTPIERVDCAIDRMAVRAGRPRADAGSRIAPYVPDAAHPDGERPQPASYAGDADDHLSVAGLGVHRLLGVRIPLPAVDHGGRHEFQGAEEAREVLH